VKNQIPTIDLRDPQAEIEPQIIKSLAKTGFVVIVGHGIPESDFAKMYECWQGFFQHPSYKERFLFNKQTQFGFFPMRSETAKGAKVSDLKEFYHFFGNQKQDLPPLPLGLPTITKAVFGELEAVALQLLTMIERGTPTGWNKCDRPWSEAVNGSVNTLLRILHYPPLDTDKVEGDAVRAAAHEDINFLTLLPSATEPGLQVQDNDGNWHDVSVTEKNSIIVNVGDMLKEASGGYYKSTTHRVVNPDGSANVSRYSMPLFLHATPNTRLSPRYTAHEYLMERLKELGLI
jgi:isopenicillin N synthase-like dioxygenase